MARPARGAEEAFAIDGDPAAQERLHVILQTVAGTLSTDEAATQLGVSREWIRRMRKRALEAACESLAPGRRGRPRTDATENPLRPRVEQLQAQIAQLTVALEAARIRAEIAMVMPHLHEKKRARRAKRPGGSAPR